jgi:hypothetical protein
MLKYNKITIDLQKDYAYNLIIIIYGMLDRKQVLTILCKQTKIINKRLKCSTTTSKKALKYNKNNYKSTKRLYEGNTSAILLNVHTKWYCKDEIILNGNWKYIYLLRCTTQKDKIMKNF